jgi:hypothetical protein
MLYTSFFGALVIIKTKLVVFFVCLFVFGISGVLI